MKDGINEVRAGFAPLQTPRNMTAALVDRLTKEITSGKLKPNEKLPTEQEMIASLGVSRTVVREASSPGRARGYSLQATGGAARSASAPNASTRAKRFTV